MSNRSVLIGILVWLATAIGFGATGVTASLRPPLPQLILFAITAICLFTVFLVPSLRAWALEVDERILVAFHLTRFVGFYFLVLYGRGELPYEFAVVGGWGDILVAVLAIVLLLLGRPTSSRKRAAYAAWNIVGLVDILFVVASAARAAMADPESLRPLQRLPLNLLLTFVVPLIIATHVILGYRLARQRTERSRP